MKNVTGVIVNGKEITLVGTAHVSSNSVKQVKEVIKAFKPDVVGVELDKKRYNALKNPEFSNSKVSTIIRNGDFKLLLFQTLLLWYQNRIGEGLKVKPGAEMVEALKVAKKNNIKVEFIDRDVNVTLNRLLNSLSIKEKFNLLVSLFDSFSQDLTGEDVEKLKEESSVDALIKAISKESPSLKKVLIDERDVFIAHKLKSIKAKRVVAFIGAGHIKGVKKYLFNETRMVRVEKKKKKGSFWNYLFPSILVGLFFIGLFKSPEYSGLMLLLYSISTFIGAFIGGVISLAHPLSILVGAISAPFTVLHPLLTSGMVSSLVESKYRKVKVKDLNNLVKINSISTVYGNNLSRLLLIFVLTNLFTTLSAFLIFPFMISLLF